MGWDEDNEQTGRSLKILWKVGGATSLFLDRYGSVKIVQGGHERTTLPNALIFAHDG